MHSAAVLATRQFVLGNLGYSAACFQFVHLCFRRSFACQMLQLTGGIQHWFSRRHEKAEMEDYSEKYRKGALPPFHSDTC